MSKNLTVRQVAEIFNRSVKTIYRWIREGYITDVRKVRDGYLIPQSEVERLLDESKVDPWLEK